MQEKLAKRLTALSQTLIVITLVSLVGLLKRLDSEQIRRDVIDLDALAEVGDKSPTKLASANATHAAVWRWLGERHPDLDGTRLGVRERITAWLQENRWTERELMRLTGKAQSEPLEGKVPFFTEEILVPVPRDEREHSDEAGPPPPDSVAALLERHADLFGPTRITVATAIDKPEVVGNVDGTREILQIRLSGQKIRVNVRVNPSQAKQQTAEEAVDIPAAVEVRTGPSLWELCHAELEVTDLLQGLAGDAERRAQLRAKYGLLAIGDAQSIARRSLGQAYESIGLFGFSFSPRRFPFAVLLLALLTLGATVMSVLRAQPGMFKDIELETAFDLVLDKRVFRFAVWTLFPPLSVFFALPAIPPTRVESAVLWAGSAGLVALGLVSFLASRKL